MTNIGLEKMIDQEMGRDEKDNLGVPWRLSRLRIQHCDCSDSGHCCSAGLIHGPETFKPQVRQKQTKNP